jgi:hypothetical protein
MRHDRRSKMHSTTARFRRVGSIVLVLALILSLGGCFRWAHRECRGHGGLAHVRMIGKAAFAVCKDGTWHAEHPG